MILFILTILPVNQNGERDLLLGFHECVNLQYDLKPVDSNGSFPIDFSKHKSLLGLFRSYLLCKNEPYSEGIFKIWNL